MILGIDSSTSCGWALFANDGTRLQSGAWDLRPSKVEGCGSRFAKLHERLDSLRRTWPRITHVAYELPGGSMRSQDVCRVLYGLAAHVESWCETNDIEYWSFAPKQVKNAAGLSGNAEKFEMVAAAEARWAPYTFATDDEADACFAAVALIEWLRSQPENCANG